MKISLTWLVLLVVIPSAFLVTLGAIYPLPYDGGMVACEKLLAEVANESSWSGLRSGPLHDAPGIKCDFELRDGTQVHLEETAWGWWAAHVGVIAGALVFAWRSLRARLFYAIVLAGTLLDLWLGVLLASDRSGFMFLTVRFGVALGLSALLLRMLHGRRRSLAATVFR